MSYQPLPAAVPIKLWPAEDSTASEIHMFLYQRRGLDLGATMLGSDFGQPHPEVTDTSMYTAPPGFSFNPFCPLLAGVVLSKVVTDANSEVQTFTIGPPLHSRLREVFLRALATCATIMDVDEKKVMLLVPVSDICWLTSTPHKMPGSHVHRSLYNDTQISVDVSYRGGLRTEFICHDNTCGIHIHDGDHPLALGDTVVIQATLHKHQGRSHSRTYRLHARRLRVINLLPDTPESPSNALYALVESPPQSSTPANRPQLHLATATETSSNSPPSLHSPLPFSPILQFHTAEDDVFGVVSNAAREYLPGLSVPSPTYMIVATTPQTTPQTPMVLRSATRQMQLGSATRQMRTHLPSPPSTPSPKKKRKPAPDPLYDGPAKRLRRHT
ncbi:hypothetical protein C8R43DRAFT_960433 [Mycena crocata]|nr:hypothetical protein C8R43DRAFT_960433 [Mycena crocata]